MEIPDAAMLLRHVSPLHWNTQEGRVSSAAFTNYRLSMNWQAVSGVEETRKADSIAVISLVAGACRELGQAVEHAPIPASEEFGPNPAHTEVVGKKTKPISTKLASMARLEWLKPIEVE